MNFAVVKPCVWKFLEHTECPAVESHPDWECDPRKTDCGDTYATATQLESIDSLGAAAPSHNQENIESEASDYITENVTENITENNTEISTDIDNKTLSSLDVLREHEMNVSSPTNTIVVQPAVPSPTIAEKKAEIISLLMQLGGGAVGLNSGINPALPGNMGAFPSSSTNVFNISPVMTNAVGEPNHPRWKSGSVGEWEKMEPTSDYLSLDHIKKLQNDILEMRNARVQMQKELETLQRQVTTIHSNKNA